MACALPSDHIKTKERVMQEHEAKLGKLETYATQSADEIREKLQRVQNSIKVQNAIMVRSQALAARYKEIWHDLPSSTCLHR